MSGRRRGGSGRGLKQGSIATFVALGCCLLSAPTAHADFDDLFDNVIGAAAAGAEQADLAGVAGDPGDLGGLDIQGVLNDPLAQLDQMFHAAPDAPASAGPDASPDAPADAGHDGSDDANAGAEHSSEGGSSNNLPSLPKFSLPNTGSGSGGSGGSGGGSPGGSGGGDTKPKPKVNASASNGNPAEAAAPEPVAVP